MLACAGERSWIGACGGRNGRARWSPRRRCQAPAAARPPAQPPRGVITAALPARQAGREHARAPPAAAARRRAAPRARRSARRPRARRARPPRARPRSAAPGMSRRPPRRTSAPASARDAPTSSATLASTAVTSFSACAAHSACSAQPPAPSSPAAPPPAACAPGGGSPARSRRSALHVCTTLLALLVRRRMEPGTPHIVGSARCELPIHARPAWEEASAEAEAAGIHTAAVGQRATLGRCHSAQRPRPHLTRPACTRPGMRARCSTSLCSAAATNGTRPGHASATALHPACLSPATSSAMSACVPQGRARASPRGTARSAAVYFEMAAERAAAGAPPCLER